MTDNNGIFTVSDLGGGDPHAFWVTGLPHAQEPHIWEQQPQQDLATLDQQLMLRGMLFDAEHDQLHREIAAQGPVIADPSDPSTWNLPTRQEANRGAEWRSFQFSHPFRARLIQWLSRR